MFCSACPTLAHCHSGPVSLWQPQPLLQDSGCLREKETNIAFEIVTEFPPILPHSVKYDFGKLYCS